MCGSDTMMQNGRPPMEDGEALAKARWLAFIPWNIPNNENTYMRRWMLVPWNRRLNVYLHRFMRDDDDRALHDHPADNVSILLKGSYREHTPDGVLVRSAPQVIFRKAEAQHRIELIDGKNVWTIFVAFRKRREWGFHCAQGWKHWKAFTSKNQGCNEP